MSNNKIVYLDGRFLPEQEAKISPMDRGFLFADGVYEVIACYHGRCFGLLPHLQRLAHSLEGLRIEPTETIEEMATLINQLIKQNQIKDCCIYLQITRGAPQERKLDMSRAARPTVFITTLPIHSWDKLRAHKGLKAITGEDIRCRFGHIKTVNKLGNLLLKQNAFDQDADDCIIVEKNLVLEATQSNVFVVRENKLYTPPLTNTILAGITRQTLIEVAGKENLPCVEKEITIEEMMAADEVWLSNTSQLILPVIEIDKRTIGNGKPGPMWIRCFNALAKTIEQEVLEHETT